MRERQVGVNETGLPLDLASQLKLVATNVPRPQTEKQAPDVPRQLCKAVLSVVDFETRTNGVADRTKAASPACNAESIKWEAL